jgi:hypothetical protein
MGGGSARQLGLPSGTPIAVRILIESAFVALDGN